MIETNLTAFVGDLGEVLNEFPPVENVSLYGEKLGEQLNIKVNIEGVESEFNYDFKPSSSLIEKRLSKRFAKLSLYKALTARFGYNLPWGALTGIRPTKLAYQQGEEWENFFKDTMLVSEEKIDIVRKILNCQKGIYRKNKADGDLFVSVPFCPTRCAYCSFLSNEIGKEKRVNEYIDALIEEIAAAKPLIKSLRSVYVGGGTPVSLSDELFEKLLRGISVKGIEYTVEAGRPDCITENKLKIMKDCGVTRLCVNPQTFCDKTLEIIGRKHTASDIVEKYRLAKSYGFLINMDLIAGLPEESFTDFKNSIEAAISLNPDNVTVHTLCLKKGSKLKESVSRLDEGEVAKMVDYAHAVLQKAGYAPYYLYRQKYMAGNLENTGYAKEGSECIYNVDIMEETTNIVACGANAVSKKVDFSNGKIVRLGAPKDIATYLNKVAQIIEDKISLFS